MKSSLTVAFRIYNVIHFLIYTLYVNVLVHVLIFKIC